MPTPDWRGEKSAALIQHLCRMLQRSASAEGAPAQTVMLTRGDLGFLLWNATKLYCDAREEGNDDRARAWSPELPEFLLNHPERCEETPGIVADPDYRDPYYDGLGKPGHE